MHKSILIFSILLPQIVFSSAIVVSADRLPSELETTSNQVFVYDRNIVATSQDKLLWEKLDETPGLSVSNSGGQGQTSTLFIRGAESRHSLILFEGVELNDASSTGNLADLSQLSLNNVERIEVLPGSQSVLYGSDAIGGVVSISLVDLEKVVRPHSEYNASVGSHFSHSLGLNHYNTVGKTSYFLSAGQISSEGISQTRVGASDKSEKDGHYQVNITGKVLHRFSDNFQLSFLTKFVNSTIDLDKGFGAIRDDVNYDSTSDNLLYKIEGKSTFLGGAWESNFSFSSINNTRKDKDEVDDITSSISTFDSSFTRRKLSNQNNFFLNKKNTIVAGFEHETEIGETKSLSSGTISGLSETSEENQSLYLLHKRTDRIFWSAGLRAQRHEEKSVLTYKIAPGLKFDKGRSWFSFSTGFKNPSLFQRNSTSYGNKNLKAEESKSYELGLEKNFYDKFKFGLVFFYLDINNLIDTTGSFPNISYVNLNSASIKGVSLSTDHKYGGFSLIRQNALEKSGLELINREKLSIKSYLKTYWQDFDFTISSIYKGPKDSGSSFSRTRLGGYTVFNGKISYSFKQTMLIWLNLNNLLNKEYTEISDFNTDRFNFKLGFNWRY